MAQFSSDYLEELRRRAEARLNRMVLQAAPDLSRRAIKRLVEELNVREVELEMQCDELQRAHDEIEESRDRYRELYESIPIGFATIDEKGRVYDINPAGLTILGSGRDHIQLHGFHSFIAERDANRFTLLCRRALQRHENTADEFWLVKAGGGIFPAHVQALVVGHGAGAHGQIRIAFKDITVRKKSEETSRRHEIQLEALTAKLFSAQEDERKRLATDLHDHLQQMLVIIKLKLAQGKRLSESSPLSTVLAEIDLIINDALTYTRTLLADLSPPVLRDHGLEAALAWLARQMKKYDLNVTVSLPDRSLGLDEARSVLLFQCVRELLMNTRKHSGVAEAVVVMDHQGDELRIEVSDRGKGFSPTDAATSVEALSQFGLFSIRERMRAAGGSFEVASSPYHGTRSILAIKGCTRKNEVIDEAAFPSVERDRRIAGKEPITVLLVDDHAMMRQGLRTVLETYPDIKIVGEAANGKEAVTMTEQLRPKIVVMDINMPVMNGVEATQHITKRFPDTAVIGLSVNAGSESTKAIMNAGASQLITKEAAVDKLYLSIQMMLGPSR